MKKLTYNTGDILIGELGDDNYVDKLSDYSCNLIRVSSGDSMLVTQDELDEYGYTLKTELTEERKQKLLKGIIDYAIHRNQTTQGKWISTFIRLKDLKELKKDIQK